MLKVAFFSFLVWGGGPVAADMIWNYGPYQDPFTTV